MTEEVAEAPRRGLSPAQRAEMWARWKAGESMSDIGRALGKHPGSIFTFLAVQGGIARPSRCRAAWTLSAVDREQISRGLAAGDSLRAIARALGRPVSTISREVARNGGRAQYRALVADRAAWDRAQRPKRCRLVQAPRLATLVARKLERDWSPEQIAGWLRRTYPGDPQMHVSHETIYRTLYVQARGALKRGCWRICGGTIPCGAVGAIPRSASRGAASSTPSRSPNGRPASTRGPCPGTGKGICWPALGIRISRRSWNGSRATSNS